MDLATIEPALCALVATLTGIEPACVVFENAPRPRFNTFLALLSWVSTVGAGVDETRWDYAENADPLMEMTASVSGQRKAVLQVSVEGLDQRPGHTARNVLETMRTRLQAPSALDALRAVGLAFAGADVVRATDYRVDGRWVPRSIVEVKLNAISEITDAQTSYIATASVATTITHPDGSAVDTDIAPGGTAP